uniref:Uncharacterized protein n=1 Tax=Candidatus Kentrum sp. FW TaxID=2126338 RepID=A0A450TN55_9GAMM|nr:MAG: hypothetical protein BECKFW1821B_GA0114236_11611 [Candidatus Kentron sp. FW]
MLGGDEALNMTAYSGEIDHRFRDKTDHPDR